MQKASFKGEEKWRLGEKHKMNKKNRKEKKRIGRKEGQMSKRK